MENNQTNVAENSQQADFIKWIPKLLFGGGKNNSEPKPVLFWSMLALVILVLVGFGIFAYKKWLK